MPNSNETNSFATSPRLNLGTAYYPEHWPEERWPEDIRLMHAAGLTVVRMAEFAWSMMEPSAGKFDFDWLERAIGLLAEKGISSVLGTPTAAPPAWLVQKHPDLLAVDENGQRVQFGNRCHFCVNSPEFHAVAQHIVEAMAKHFGKNAHVIGWQIDNEYNRVCYCERCRGLFQQYLKEKFDSLDTLNEHWATRYWSETYSAWEQIPIPIGYHNPGLMLEFKHFITASYRKFQKMQLDILRPHLKPDVWVTHNFMGWHGGYDHYEIARDLDLASWDWYVGTGHHDHLTSGAMHDLVRGFKRHNFWLMETQPGHVNWSSINNELNKGEARVMAWHAVAHGAEGILYWQWRSAIGGQEQYHGTLIDQSGQPRPFYEEVQQLGRDFKAASDLLAGSAVKAEVALLNCYDSRWSIQWQRHHGEFDYVIHFNSYYRPLAVRNVNVDVISADEPLDGYRLVIAPALLILDENRVEHLKEFVKRGGFLILTLRTGMKDRFNALLPVRQPGPLAELAGVEVEDYYALQNPVPVKGNLFAGTSKLWAERLKVLDTKMTVPAAHYGPSNGWLDNQPAITVHPYGRGMVYYIGAYLDEASQQTLMDHILATAEIRTFKSPPNVEVRKRISKTGQDIYIVINHGHVEQDVQFPWPVQEYLSHQEMQGTLKLSAYGVAIVTKNDQSNTTLQG
jgi:beta-galactosidase